MRQVNPLHLLASQQVHVVEDIQPASHASLLSCGVQTEEEATVMRVFSVCEGEGGEVRALF